MKRFVIPLILAAFVAPGIALADEGESLAKKNGCLKCHAVDKKKDGPSYKEVAKKYHGKAGAEDKLVTFITKGGKIKVDGVEDDHKTVKGGDVAAAKEIVKWILSR